MAEENYYAAKYGSSASPPPTETSNYYAEKYKSSSGSQAAPLGETTASNPGRVGSFLENSRREVGDIYGAVSGAIAGQYRPNAPQTKPQTTEELRNQIRQARDTGHLAGDYSQIPAAAGAAVTAPIVQTGGRFIAESLPQVEGAIDRVTGWKPTNTDPAKLKTMGEEAMGTALAGAMPGRIPVPGAAPVPPARPLGVTLSERQATNVPGAVAADARPLINETTATGPRAEQFRTQQAGQVAAAKEDITRSLSPTGQVEAATPQEAADIAQRRFQTEAQSAKADVDTRFEAARGQGGAIHGGSIQSAGDTVRAKLDAPGPNRVLVNDKLTPQTSNMLEHLDQRLAANGGNPMSLEDVDQLRRELGDFRTKAWANDSVDGRAASAAVRAFNEHINASVNSGDFIGPPAAKQAWNDAVAASAKYKGTFKSDDKIGSVVKQVLGDYKNSAAIPNDVADKLYGATGVNPNSANVGLANRFKQVLGETSSEWGAVKQGMWQRLTSKGEGQTEFGPKQIADRINKFLNGDGKEMAEAMYSPTERATMQAFADLHRQLELPASLAKHPEAQSLLKPLMGFIQNKVAGAVGWLGAHAVGAGPLAEAGSALAASVAEKVTTSVKQAAELRRQLPLVTEQVAQFQKAVDAHARANSPYSAKRLSAATINLSKTLKPLGIDLGDWFAAHAQPEQGQNANGQ